MRLFSVLSAVIVALVLFVLVFQRDRVLDWAGLDSSPTDVDLMADTPDAAAPAEMPRVSVVALHSTARPVDSAVILRGRTEALRQVTVMPETSGKVISTPLRRGERVTAGQVLCELDPGTRPATLAQARAALAESRTRLPEAEARLVEARANVTEAEIGERAARELSKDGFASATRVAGAEAALERARAGLQSAQAGLEAARAGIEAAQASVLRAQEDIAHLTMTAPFDGVLENDTAELGAFLNAQNPSGTGCATVIQLDPIKLVGFVPEAQVARVALGAPARAQLVGGPAVTGTVSFVARAADPDTRTFRVEMQVPNSELALRDGQSAEIIVAAPGVQAHLLPASAMTLDGDGRLGVRIVGADDIARFAPVTLVRDTVDGALLSGLPDDAAVIVVGQDFVTDGTPIAVTYREPDA